MPGSFLNEAQRDQMDGFPAEIPPEDVVTYFTLTPLDSACVPLHSAAHNRLGFALQLCALRYLGYYPKTLTTVSADTVSYVAQQLGLEACDLSAYGERSHTKTDHAKAIEDHLRFRKATPLDLQALGAWLVDRALEHDKPKLLFHMACERLLTDKVVRPGISVVERLVVSARQKAQAETYRLLQPLLTEGCRALLDRVLLRLPSTGSTDLSLLRSRPITDSPEAILEMLDKLTLLQRWTVDTWDLSTLNPNRAKHLAQLGRRYSSQALQRMADERRYPILAAFLRQSLIDITDDLLERFDRYLAHAYSKARRKRDEFRDSVARSTSENLLRYQEIARILVDPDTAEEDRLGKIFESIPPQEIKESLEECERITRPPDDNYFDFLDSKYSTIRRFSPRFIASLDFRSNRDDDPLLQAVTLLRQLNASRRRNVPDDAPTGFVDRKWQPYVFQEGEIKRRYYELCLLYALRDGLRAGDVWAPDSRRYANPESYLIPREKWPALRPEVCRQLQAPPDPGERLDQRVRQLEQLLGEVDDVLRQGDKVRMEDGKLVVTRHEAEDKPPSLERLEHLVGERLPPVDLSDLLIEVDSWTGFSRHLEHAGGAEPRSDDLLRNLYACVIAQGCNIGLTRMAQVADLTYDQLAWCNGWYLREETLKASFSAVVDFHYHLPFAKLWGDGTLSSSDGQRFPVSGKVPGAEAIPRYFGYGKGITFYSWTSDQFSQYGTKVVSATVRDATYVLDQILDNETELDIVEHTTDTLGYTEMVFALFDLLGMQFSPRIRDLADKTLYRVDRSKRYPNLDPMLKGTIRRELILDRWDDLIRVAGSLKQGWVTASLFISKLQSGRRQSELARALQEYGRLSSTIFILRYLTSEEFRRIINKQLNKGEAVHALRRFLFFANQGRVRKKLLDEQTNQASCLNLLTNAVILWNTVYIDAIVKETRKEGIEIRDEDLARISPVRSAHVNPYGKYRFDVSAERFRNHKLRPLRRPEILER